MDLDIEIPRAIPVMILRDTVFYPQAILPLHIFEERYRRMLSDVLEANQLFAVACRDDRQAADEDDESPATVATVGIVRASQENENGTSNLVLQGVCRVRVRRLVQTDPYPMVEVEPLQPQEESDEAQIGILKAEICALLRSEEALTNEVPEEFVGFLRELDEPGTFIDLTAFAVCRCPRVKQSILEALEVPDRFRLFARYLERERDRIRLHRKLQGPLSDDSISLN